MNGLALCAGVGGLELGLQLAVPGYRCVGYCERDTFAAATLVARMESEALDQAPIWDDLATFPSELYRGTVDLITAGFPCQPFSVAGQRKGTDDERWIWGDIARVIREVRPCFVFLENVPGLLANSGGYGTLLGDLAGLGFDAEWEVFSASEVGAPQLRRRVFVLGYPNVEGSQGRSLRRKPKCKNKQPSGTASTEMGDTPSSGRERGISEPHKTRQRPFPPGPGEAEEWAELIREDPSIEPSVCRVADGGSHRVDRLRCLGNGVVPVVAALAFRALAARSGFIIN